MNQVCSIHIKVATAIDIWHVYRQSDVLYFSCSTVKKTVFKTFMSFLIIPMMKKNSVNYSLSTTMVPMIPNITIYVVTMSLSASIHPKSSKTLFLDIFYLPDHPEGDQKFCKQFINNFCYPKDSKKVSYVGLQCQLSLINMVGPSQPTVFLQQLGVAMKLSIRHQFDIHP